MPHCCKRKAQGFQMYRDPILTTGSAAYASNHKHWLV